MFFKRFNIHRGFLLHSACSALCSVLAVGDASAALGYRVELQGPSTLTALLEKHLSVSRWRDSEYLDAAQLERLHEVAPEEIQSMLATQGYFAAKVEASKVADGASWILRYRIEPGAQARIDEVDVTLQGPIRERADYQPRLADLLEAWPLPMGSMFTQNDWDGAKRRGLQSLLLDRYPAARIDSSLAEVDADKASVALSVVYNSGPPFRLGALQISGLKRYPKQLVERMAGFAAGDAYSHDKLLNFQQALQDAPYFNRVLVEAIPDVNQADSMPVRVELVEAPLQRVTAGAGLSTDTGARGSLGYQYNNLLQRGWIGTADLNLDNKNQSLALGLQLPPDDSQFRDSVLLKQVHSTISGVQLWQRAASVQRSRKVERIEMIYGLQWSDERASQPDVNGVPTTLQRQALVISETWTRRAVDNLADPSDGLLLSARVAGAVGGLLSDTSFVHLYARAVRYWPLGRGRVIARAELGNVFAHDRVEVPSDWLFRAGGSGSVRGYRYLSLGVKEGDSVLPGRALATASLEYQHPVVGKWRAAVFADVGGAAGRWQDMQMVKGVGSGARWASPVGPLAVDLAYGLQAKSWQLHFSLGVGF